MVVLLFSCFIVTSSRLKNKEIHFKLTSEWIFIFSLLSYERKVDKWKKSFEYYSSNVCEPLEIDTTT